MSSHRPHRSVGDLSRKDFLRRTGALAALISAPPILVAGGRGSAAPAPAALSRSREAAVLDIVRWAYPSGSNSLDVAKARDAPSSWYRSNALEGLLAFDDSGQSQPLLAESWEQPDPLTYVFTLREGVTFWDGTELTADDVVFSLERHRDPSLASQIASYFENITSITASGPLEVTVELTKPDASFVVQVISSDAGQVIQRRHAEEHGNELGTPSSLIMGTGPYQVTSFNPDEGVTLERNESYWGEPPPIQTIEITSIPEDATRLLAFRSGEIDGTSGVPLGRSSDWEIEGATLVFGPAVTLGYVAFDLNTEPWSDLNVRKAIAHGVDRQAIVDVVMGGHAEVASTIVSPAEWGGLLSPEEAEELYAELPQYPFDLDLAREALAQSAFPDGFSATVTTADTAFLLDTALVMSETLREIGIELDVKEEALDSWFDRFWAHRDLGLFPSRFGAEGPDPAARPGLLLHSRNAVENGYNQSEYQNAEVDALLDQQAGESDPAERVRVLMEILRTTATDLPYLALNFQPGVAVAVGGRINFEPKPWGPTAWAYGLSPK